MIWAAHYNWLQTVIRLNAVLTVVTVSNPPSLHTHTHTYTHTLFLHLQGHDGQSNNVIFIDCVCVCVCQCSRSPLSAPPQCVCDVISTWKEKKERKSSDLFLKGLIKTRITTIYVRALCLLFFQPLFCHFVEYDNCGPTDFAFGCVTVRVCGKRAVLISASPGCRGRFVNWNKI